MPVGAALFAALPTDAAPAHDSIPARQTSAYRPASLKPSAAVIGAGFGGLALAIRLQIGGFDTTVIEKRDRPGGRAYV